MNGQSTNHIVIPAHFHSTRLPGKVLLDKTGKSLIQHTWENACRIKFQHPDYNFQITIATDNDEIEKRCTDFGAKVIRTGRCANGTQRVLEAAKYLPIDRSVSNTVINYQVDCPFLPGQLVVELIQLMHQIKMPILSACYKTGNQYEILDKDNVKVVHDCQDRAIYFSRSPIPHDAEFAYIHIGLYVFHFQILDDLRKIEANPNVLISEREKLEQNKWIYANLPIIVPAYKGGKVLSINTPEDYETFVKEYQALAEL